MDFLHVITLDLNALLPSAVQTVNGIDKVFTWNVEVDRATNFVLETVPVLEDAAAQKLLQSREESEIGRCEIRRVRWVGEKLEMKSLKSLDRTHGSMRSCVIVQEKVESLLEEDARLTVRELADRVGSPPTNVFRAIKDDIGLVRLSARWVPPLLTQDMKNGRVNFCKANLERVDAEDGWEQLRVLIVTGDETWVPYFDPPTKQESMVSKFLLILMPSS